ncbi:hypothetical protein LAJ19_20615 (plasmid) [Deinococcus taeanensis]|uniref:hypothetical protein n=1 Tax=Deinococcus taeanensis TaxID=2737050 RepID=UPI001CDCB8EF|nr:hypothetical protein [Deinococcus taeanensis]UBV45211.1 hypothetical protein LAJ19_20615 [Deinococcus taeanensis]
MTLRAKRQRTFKFSDSTETQIAHLCQVTGSGATAVVEQAVTTRYRELFGKRALWRLVPSGQKVKTQAQTES